MIDKNYSHYASQILAAKVEAEAKIIANFKKEYPFLSDLDDEDIFDMIENMED